MKTTIDIVPYANTFYDVVCSQDHVHHGSVPPSIGKQFSECEYVNLRTKCECQL